MKIYLIDTFTRNTIFSGRQVVSVFQIVEPQYWPENYRLADWPFKKQIMLRTKINKEKKLFSYAFQMTWEGNKNYNELKDYSGEYHDLRYDREWDVRSPESYDLSKMYNFHIESIVMFLSTYNIELIKPN